MLHALRLVTVVGAIMSVAVLAPHVGVKARDLVLLRTGP
jgi:hypothetical protein